MYRFLFLILFLLPASSYAEETITVAVASSLYPVMQQQLSAFEKRHGVQVKLISGSTGRLYNQIIQGAPFDLFIAADEIRPAKLSGLGMVNAEEKAGFGYLGVKSGDNLFTDLKLLHSASIHRIAIPNPDVAPFGMAAKKLLQQQGLWHVLKFKFIYTQNAMQAIMMVDQGLVDAGFVPLAGPEDAIAQIAYQAVLLSDNPIALQFLKFVAEKKESVSTLVTVY